LATPGHTVGHQSVVVDMDDGPAVMIGDAAFTADIYREADAADLSRWPGQHSDRKAWTGSLERLHGMHPLEVHFCHDTRTVGRSRP
jgi:glyoxylase-like metal-dependent hydrolase (beta-lactamase superfamily II)